MQEGNQPKTDQEKNNKRIATEIPLSEHNAYKETDERSFSVEDPNLDYKDIMEDKIKEGINHLSRPLIFAKIVVYHPFLLLTACLSFLLIISIIVFITGISTLNEFYYRDFLVWDSKQVQEFDAERLSVEAIQTNYPGGIQPLRIINNEFEETYLAFELEEGDIFTLENIKEMHYVEQEILNLENFSNFCLAKNSTDSS